MPLLRDRRLGHGPRAATKRRSREPPPRFTIAFGAVLLILAGASRTADAVTLDDPQIGGIGFSGPTTGDLAAIYWNPAALGLMHGLNVTLTGTAKVATTTVSRAPIDATTGRPGPGMNFPDARAVDRSQPFVWPPGPGAFAGLSYDAGGDRLTLAFATYMPFVDRSTYQATPGQALATRYHRISADLRNLALVTAIAVRFAGDFRWGFAPGVLLSTGRLSFAESTCAASGSCAQAEDPAADALLDLGSGMGILSSSAAVTLATGFYFRRRAWEFGLSYSSRPLGTFGGSAVIAGEQSQITRAPRDVTATTPATVTCDNGRSDGRGCLFSDLTYKLPQMLAGSVAWHPRPGLEVAAIARILSFPAHDVIDIRLTGTTLAAAGVPEHIVLHRGYGTVWDTRLRISSWVAERVRLGAGLRMESSALPAGAVSPAAVDGRKVEPTAMILVRPTRHIGLAAGYGFTYMLPVTASSSVFDPTAAKACADSGGDLSGSPCLLRREGLARGTAAGTYRRFEHTFSLSITAQF